MRELHLFLDRQERRFVRSLTDGNTIASLSEVQDDTLRVIIHNAVRNPAVPALTPFVERPLSATAVRIAIGTADAPPQSGTFKLRVDGQTTGAITWPTDLSTPALLTTWKASIITALEALSNVAVGDIRLDDPAGTPGHIFYLTWTDEDREDPIEVVSNRLIPWIEPDVLGSATSIGYTQRVKLAQFPRVMSTTFTQPSSPPCSILTTRAGATGVNAEQTLTVPANATGSFSLTWSGVSTKTISVSAVTAAALSTALNAVVAGGATTPAFRVEERAQRSGKRFAIELIGPLAAATQPDLGVTMHDQEALPYWSGDIQLGGLGIDMALNGAPSVTLTFELVIAEGGGEETYLLPITLINDLTKVTTAASASASGAIFVEVREIFVDAGLGEPFVEASPGYTFVPTGPGNSLAVSHPLSTWRPRVTLTLHAVDHDIFAADPSDLAAALTSSHALDDSEYSQTATSDSTVSIGLPFTLVDDPTSPLDYRLLAVDISTPITQLTRFDHTHFWTDVREAGTLKTAAEKFAELDSALGAFGGTLQINAAQIVGTLVANQLDLTSLSTALQTSPAFQTTLNTIFASSTTIQSTLVTALTASSTFVTNLSTLIEENTAVSNAIVNSIAGNNNFSGVISEAVNNVLTGGAPVWPDGVLPIAGVRPVAPEVLPSRRVPADVSIQSITDHSALDVRPLPQWLRRPGALMGAQHDATVASVSSLPGSPAIGDVISNSSSTPIALAPYGGWPGENLLQTEHAAWDGRFWYKVRRSGTTSSYFPIAMEREWRRCFIAAAMLKLGGEFTWQFTQDLGIIAGNVTGQCKVIVEWGTASSQSSPGTTAPNLDTVTWNATPLLTETVRITGDRQLHNFGVKVLRSSGGTVTAKQLKYTGGWGDADSAPSGVNFYVRARIIEWDLENAPADPRGYLYRAMPFSTAGVL